MESLGIRTELLSQSSSYVKHPCFHINSSANECYVGWPDIIERIKGTVRGNHCQICVECYPGTFEPTIRKCLAQGLAANAVIFTPDLLRPAAEIDEMLSSVLGDDPVFGRMNTIGLEDFFDPGQLARTRVQAQCCEPGLLLIVGTGASLVAPEPDILVYADLTRWEIQRRQRQNKIGNLGADNLEDSPAKKYKRSFFVDWRAADKVKMKLLPRIDFLLDTNGEIPKLVTGGGLREGLRKLVENPFRVVPFFDPGPWGGHWMERVCELPRDAPNHAWCFDCVPEENSLLLGFGKHVVEIPAINLTFLYPRELLGEEVYSRFGAEFPIRFDLLDTMGGGNLSLQVHPKTEYMLERFGMNYTQDESYYLLDAGEDGSVYLGVKPDVQPEKMIQDLRAAQNGGPPFRVENYINQFPARKHDHFLVPAGTIHCSGRNSMVLEISATPYIFTFKLWDWARLGLNGEPRPIHIEHGRANICWDRDTDWVKRNLINRIEPISEGPDWKEERTGLHELEFIETRRHWFAGPTPHATNGTVNIVNLIEGREVTVESPTGGFEPFVVHYAETFIVPACVGQYRIRPSGESEGRRCGTIKAFVRSNRQPLVT